MNQGWLMRHASLPRPPSTPHSPAPQDTHVAKVWYLTPQCSANFCPLMPLDSNVSSSFSRCSRLTLIRPMQSVLMSSPSILQSSVVAVIPTTYTTALSCGEDIFHGATLSTYVKNRMKSLQKQIDKVTAMMIALKVKSPSLNQAVELLTVTKGGGDNSTLSLLVAMPELGKISNKEATSLAGLAPFNRDSAARCGGNERSSEGAGRFVRLSTWPLSSAPDTIMF